MVKEAVQMSEIADPMSLIGPRNIQEHGICTFPQRAPFKEGRAPSKGFEVQVSSLELMCSCKSLGKGSLPSR